MSTKLEQINNEIEEVEEDLKYAQEEVMRLESGLQELYEDRRQILDEGGAE